MNFTNFASLPEAIKETFDEMDYICYVRVYYRGKRYGSQLFFKGATSGVAKEIKAAEELGEEKYTEEMRNEVQAICEMLFDEKCPGGPDELYSFCEANGFDQTPGGYLGYCVLEHSVCHIMVIKNDGYFCRVFFHEK